MLSQSSQSGENSTPDAAAIDARLAESLARLAPLSLPQVSLRYRQVHIGRGDCGPGVGFHRHRHQLLQFEVVLAGRFRFTTPEAVHDLDAWHALAVPPGHLHDWRCLHRGLLVGCEITVEGPGRDEFLSRCRSEGTSALPVLPPTLCRPHWEPLVALLHAPDTSPWQRERIAHRLALWLIDATEAAFALNRWPTPSTPELDPATRRAAAICDRVETFLRTHIQEPVHLGDVAAHTGLSVRHLTRIYRNHTGTSVNETLLSLRLERACTLLAETPKRSIKDIAYSLGFSSPAYFTRCFREAFAMPPGQWRNTPFPPP